MITIIIRFITLRFESETPKGRGESAHTGKTDQRPPRDRAYVQYLKTVIPFTSSVLEKAPLYPSKIRPLG